MARRPKVLYLYAGSRKEFYNKWQQGRVADTQLLGLNYMDQLGIDAEFLEWPVAKWLRRVSFNLVHLPYLLAIRRYDIVFLGAGLPLVFTAKWLLRWKKPKFVIYNTYLTNALKRHPRGLIHFITKKAIRGLDMIVCTSKQQKEFLIAQDFNRQKIICRPIGIDAKRFVEESKERPRPPEYILSVGRDLGRDYKTLFEAVKDLPVRVKVATKPEAVVDLVIPKNVKVLYHVPYEEMPALYQGAYFAVVPLRDFEDPKGSDTSGQYGFLEPMASGKAVIVTDKDTVRDYIDHEKEGLLVPAGDPAALRSAVQRLLADEDLRNALARAGQKKVLQDFTSEKFAGHLANIFKTLYVSQIK